MSDGVDDSVMADLHAYVDGELEAQARADFEARLRQDPALQQALAREQRLREALGLAYAPVLSEPLPERLTDLLKKPGAAVLAIDQARTKRGQGFARTWSYWGGIAASLVLGIVLGRQLLPPSPDANLALAVDGGLAAQAGLARALDEQLSRQRLGAVTPGLSFVAKGGAYCRSFVSEGGAASAGLACRDGAQWRLRQLLPLPATAGSGPQFRTAATALPAELLQRIDELREGDTLDAEAERQARARGWQR